MRKERGKALGYLEQTVIDQATMLSFNHVDFLLPLFLSPRYHLYFCSRLRGGMSGMMTGEDMMRVGSCRNQ